MCQRLGFILKRSNPRVFKVIIRNTTLQGHKFCEQKKNFQSNDNSFVAKLFWLLKCILIF